MSEFTLIARPNGAGKSSLTRQLVQEGGLLDGVRPENPTRVAFEAGRKALRRANGYLGQDESFAVETTLSEHRGLASSRKQRSAVSSRA